MLIVDVDASLPDAVDGLLLGAEIRTRSVRDAAAAIEAAREIRPDLILVDARRPGVDALNACRALQAAHATALAPVLLIGAIATDAEIARARETGVAEVLRHPFEPELLRLRMNTLLTLSRTRTLQRQTSELLASMGHEIRTPLTAILGMSHLALQSGLNPKQRNYIEKVQHSAELLLDTLNDVLDFSNIGAGTLELHRSLFQLADALDSVARLVALKADEKGIELLIDAPADLPIALVGDSARLRQVLIDLGAYAIRCMDGGEIVLGVERVAHEQRHAQLRFWVSGNGPIPMPPRDISATSGLEMVISQHLIGLMGSTLIVQDGVLSFTATFETDGTTIAAPATRSGSGSRVLIVDDSPGARRVLTAMCESLGLKADAAADGWDAMRQIALARQAGRAYALVLLDAQMPGMDGAECARLLARGEAPPPLVLLASAFGREEVVRRLAAQRVVVRSVLAKPLTPAMLRATCASAVQNAGTDNAAAPTSDAELLRLHRAQLRGAKLLLVEDNAIIQELALELLGSAGIDVTVAENGKDALQLLASQTFDGVLMDCQMPVMDGFEATRALRELPQFKQLPVIALTADSLEGDRDRVIKAGMNDHIGKPFEVSLMFATLARWVHPAVGPVPIAAVEAPASGVSDDPLARLPGIDARVGRSSTMSNDVLYRRLLGMFREGQRNFGPQFNAARAKGDDATAMRLAHNLRAVSGSLGAVAVQHSASALERACARGESGDVIGELLDAVVSDLEPVITGLGELTN